MDGLTWSQRHPSMGSTAYLPPGLGGEVGTLEVSSTSSFLVPEEPHFDLLFVN